jgi:hypothetical protein
VGEIVRTCGPRIRGSLPCIKEGKRGTLPVFRPLFLARALARSLTLLARARSLSLALSLSRFPSRPPPPPLLSLAFVSLSLARSLARALSLSGSVWIQDHFNDILSNSGAMATAAAASRFPQLWSPSLPPTQQPFSFSHAYSCSVGMHAQQRIVLSAEHCRLTSHMY